MIRNYKNSTVNYETFEGEDTVDFQERQANTQYEFKNRTNTHKIELDKVRTQKYSNLTNLPVVDPNNSIAGELFKIQEEEMGRIQRTHSIIQNFKNLMEDQQKNTMKYSSQNMQTSEMQTQCKNRIIEMIIERYLKEYGIERAKWCDLLKEFTHRASESVKPHDFMLDAEIDVKIICNEWGSHKDSRLVLVVS